MSEDGRPGSNQTAPAMKQKIWLLSAYRADSHAAWADWLIDTFDEYDWHRYELPGRHFSWRIRGNPLSWLDALAEAPMPDLIVATSMVDLATIRGLHPRLGQVPTLLYFHENQFAYPVSDRQTTSVEAQMVQLYAALAADRVLFNSSYNRRTMIDGLTALLTRMPDQVPAGLPERIEAKSAVLPVPIRPIAPAQTRDARLIVWNHRWEYDRQPDAFADAVCTLAERGIELRLALLGSRPAKAPPALKRLREQLSDRIVADGFLAADDYRAVLARAGLVVSTSRHEFQGLAILEAVSGGCVPVVPDALVYPELFDAAFCYRADNPTALVDVLASLLHRPLPRPPDVSAWSASELRPLWSDALRDTLASHS